MVSTTRHPFKFWLILVFSIVLCLSLASLMVLNCVELYQAGKLTVKKSLAGLSALAFYAVAISLPYAYWKHSPKITVDKNCIWFGSQKFFLKDIDHYDLTAKVPLHYIISVPMEGSIIMFRDGTVRNIINDMYANSWEIKSFLKCTLDGETYVRKPISRAERVLIDSEPKEVFKDNPFTTLGELVFWGPVIVFALTYINADDRDPVGLIFLIVLLTIWFLVGSWFMNYFCVTKDFLLVGNHYLPGRRKYYRFSDIEEVVIEIPQKHPHSMRIITKDFRSKLYPASSLRTRTWRDLIKTLEKKGMSVRNECIEMND